MFDLTYPAYLREKARALRTERQLTIDELAARLALSRSTIYYWVRDLPLTRPRRENPWPGSRRKREKYRLLRQAAYEDGLRMYPTLALKPTFRDFVALYIAEGYKRCRNAVAICNSDPVVMKLGQVWIRRFARNPIRYSIQYHADQGPRRHHALLGRKARHTSSFDPAAAQVK